ncbi:LysR substrate-binding domain-containing protein [Leifsonia kafniensis]|uniref:LysR substrate-binding domain-containing protein n=1 Tax=Leifsonia kafniensis TaxID=475957 RepID=A0ABP7KNL0_9MICO
MPPFTLRQLEYFRAVAETGTFSGAATRMFVSQSAIASAIGDLESALGVQLCTRKRSSGIGLTPSGVQFLEKARALLRQADDVTHAAHHGDGLLAGAINIGCYATLAATVLPALLDEFSAQHPQSQLNFVDGTMEELMPLLEQGRLDFVITYRISLQLGLQQMALYDTAVHALLPANHPLAHAPTVSLHDLADDPLILLNIPPSGRHTLDMLASANIRPLVRHTTTNFELARSLVGRGLGYCLLVQKPEIDLTYEGLPVVAKPISPEFSREQVVLVWPDGMELSARARICAEFARATLGRAQPPR